MPKKTNEGLTSNLRDDQFREWELPPEVSRKELFECLSMIAEEARWEVLRSKSGPFPAGPSFDQPFFRRIKSAFLGQRGVRW